MVCFAVASYLCLITNHRLKLSDFQVLQYVLQVLLLSCRQETYGIVLYFLCVLFLQRNKNSVQVDIWNGLFVLWVGCRMSWLITNTFPWWLFHLKWLEIEMTINQLIHVVHHAGICFLGPVLVWSLLMLPSGQISSVGTGVLWSWPMQVHNQSRKVVCEITINLFISWLSPFVSCWTFESFRLKVVCHINNCRFQVTCGNADIYSMGKTILLGTPDHFPSMLVSERLQLNYNLCCHFVIGNIHPSVCSSYC